MEIRSADQVEHAIDALVSCEREYLRRPVSICSEDRLIEAEVACTLELVMGSGRSNRSYSRNSRHLNGCRADTAVCGGYRLE